MKNRSLFAVPNRLRVGALPAFTAECRIVVQRGIGHQFFVVATGDRAQHLLRQLRVQTAIDCLAVGIVDAVALLGRILLQVEKQCIPRSVFDQFPCAVEVHASGGQKPDDTVSRLRIGDAQVSSKHTNFFVNVGRARAADVRALIDLAREKVRKRFGLELELEIALVGEGF